MTRRSSKYQNRWTQLRSELGIAKKRKSGYHDTWRLWGKPRNNHYRQFNFSLRKFEPSKHTRGLLALFIVGLAVFTIAWSQDPTNILFHSSQKPCSPDIQKPGAPCQDPSQVIWVGPDTGSLSDFNTFTGGGDGSVNYQTPCSSIAGTSCLVMTPGAVNTVEAVSKTTIGELSTASKSLLAFHVSWSIQGTLSTAFNQGPTNKWGYFLTTNSTLPKNSQFSNPNAWYDPTFDPSVTFVQYYWCDSSCNTITPNIGSSTSTLRTLGQTDTLNSEANGCSQSGSAFLCNNILSDPSNNHNFDGAEYLNYTGVVGGTSCTVSGTPGVIGPAPGCSWNLNQPLTGQSVSTFWISTKTLPWFALQSQQYHIGFFVTRQAIVSANIQFTFDGGTSGNMDVFTFTPSATGPTIDTGGFFGPVIKALISLGVFILNAILGFIAYITPALETAFNFLESVVKTILNGVGVAFGFPASPGLGDNLFSFINSVITLFTVQVPNAFAQITPIFNSWLNLLTVVFTTGPVGEIFKLLADILGFAVNLVAFAWTVFNLAALTYSIATPWWLFIFAIAFNCDDGVDGWIKTWEFAKWLAFDVGVKTVTWLLNWTIDVVTAAIGFIPKPFIQMASAKFPRIPVIDVHGSFSMPRFDGAALKEGNLFAVFGFPSIVAGLIWYELTQTSIPGTLASLYSTQPWVNTATVAITFYKIFLPIFGLTIFLLMIPTLFSSIFGIRVEGGGIPVSFGHRPSSGVILRGGSGGPLVRPTRKHLQGRLEKKLAKYESQGYVVNPLTRVKLAREQKKLGKQVAEVETEAERKRVEAQRREAQDLERRTREAQALKQKQIEFERNKAKGEE